MFPACCFCQRTYMVQGLVNGILNEKRLIFCFFSILILLLCSDLLVLIYNTSIIYIYIYIYISSLKKKPKTG